MESPVLHCRRSIGLKQRDHGAASGAIAQPSARRLRRTAIHPLGALAAACFLPLGAMAQQLPSGGLQRFQRDQQLRDAIEQQNQRQLQELQQQTPAEPAGPEKPLETTPAFQ